MDALGTISWEARDFFYSRVTVSLVTKKNMASTCASLAGYGHFRFGQHVGSSSNKYMPVKRIFQSFIRTDVPQRTFSFLIRLRGESIRLSPVKFVFLHKYLRCGGSVSRRPAAVCLMRTIERRICLSLSLERSLYTTWHYTY